MSELKFDFFLVLIFCLPVPQSPHFHSSPDRWSFLQRLTCFSELWISWITHLPASLLLETPVTGIPWILLCLEHLDTHLDDSFLPSKLCDFADRVRKTHITSTMAPSCILQQLTHFSLCFTGFLTSDSSFPSCNVIKSSEKRINKAFYSSETLSFCTTFSLRHNLPCDIWWHAVDFKCKEDTCIFFLLCLFFEFCILVNIWILGWV